MIRLLREWWAAARALLALFVIVLALAALLYGALWLVCYCLDFEWPPVAPETRERLRE